MTFEVALPFVLQWEGGYVDDPDDPGGATNFGITQNTYTAWLRPVASRPVKLITTAEVQAIYRTNYWDAIHGNALPAIIRPILFDCAVNQGVGYARKLLQWAVGAKQDGVIGTQTLAAVQAYNPELLARELLWARMLRYVALCRAWKVAGKANPHKFLDGWIRRLDALRTFSGAL
jgi:lysozyme family protein